MSSYQEESLAEVYSLIICIDHLERAFNKDNVSENDYTENMMRLLSKYAKLTQSPEVEPIFDSIDVFSKNYQVDAKEGIERIKVGIPATAEAVHLSGAGSNSTLSNSHSGGSNARALLTVAENFVTFTDGIHLGYRSKAELHPLLADIAISLNCVNRDDFMGRQKIIEWLTKINRLKSSEQLSEEDAAKCLSDIEIVYHHFQKLL